MKIEHISTFLEIASCGNFNRAAENLNVTQSTVSARVKAMEDRFGRQLFKRSRRGVELTTSGHHLQEYALNIQRLWQQASQRILLPDNFSHSIGLGSQFSLWESLIIKWIPWMRANAKDVAIHVEADYSPSLMRQLTDGILDLGVMYMPRQTPGLIIEDLLVENLVLVTREKQNINTGWQKDYVYVDWCDDFREQHTKAFPHMETPAVSVGLGPLGLEYILQNGGSGYFTGRAVRPLIEAGELFYVEDVPRMYRPAYVVYAQSPTNPETLKLALEGLREIANQEMQ